MMTAVIKIGRGEARLEVTTVGSQSDRTMHTYAPMILRRSLAQVSVISCLRHPYGNDWALKRN